MKKILLFFMLQVLGSQHLSAVTTLSSGHVDIFEVHYDSAVDPPEFSLHVHDHDTGGHFEPADVILRVNENTLFASPAGLTSILGASAYILPSTQESDMLYGGVSADGPAGIFKNNRFSVRMISAGPGNPGNFVMYRFSGGGTLQVGLQAIGSILSVSEFTIPIGGHEHWNWGFSAPGVYTYEFQGLGVKNADLSVLETPVELFTFQVIPEPSTGTLLWLGWVGLGRFRKRNNSKPLGPHPRRSSGIGG